MKKEAYLYEKLEGNAVHCSLCAHQCRIADGAFGFCGVRKNEAGTLFTMVYANVIAANVDPIEKKPLYHFLPGSSCFSIATIGCNFRCGFCQNWEISQANVRDGSRIAGRPLPPEEAVAAALQSECQSISYTYTEPTIYFEYAYDTAKLAAARGLRNIFVTNGYMTKAALDMIAPFLDAANVDLKFFNDASYRRVCGGSLQPVLDSIRHMREKGIWVEVTTLVVPGENDSSEELRRIAVFLAGVDPDIPWHISRFFPNYRYAEKDATPEQALKKAQEAGTQAGLRYLYVGNVHGWGADTFCCHCGKPIVKREGFSVVEYQIKDNACVFCRTRIPGVFSDNARS